MNFGKALEALKEGKKVSRSGWNGKGMYIYIQNGSQISREQARNGHLAVLPEPITIRPHIDMKDAEGKIVIGWLASQTDLLAEDWETKE
jgi:hypothetical protein